LRIERLFTYNFSSIRILGAEEINPLVQRLNPFEYHSQLMGMLRTLLALIWLVGAPLDALDLNTIVENNIELGKKYNNSVNSSVEYIFIFSDTSVVSENSLLNIIL
jgi:hypothetical protein